MDAISGRVNAAGHPRGKGPARVTPALRHQVAKALDELTEMFLRQMHKLHVRGEEALDAYRKQHAERTDALIALLHDIARIIMTEREKESRLARIVSVFRP